MKESTLIDRMDENTRSSWNELTSARRLEKQDHLRGLSELNDVFRSGRAPETLLDGRYRGQLVALDIGPGFTQVFSWIAAAWMPWLGKTFDAASQSGDNIFQRDTYPLARVFNPFYRGFRPDSEDTYRGFAFRTYIAPGLTDADRTVLKIDYDLNENPSLTVRRVLDELVELDRDIYLGKAHLCWWWGSWQTVAYFVLLR